MNSTLYYNLCFSGVIKLHTQMHVWNDHPIICSNLSIHLNVICVVYCCAVPLVSHCFEIRLICMCVCVCVFDGCECLRAGVLWHEVTGFLCVAEFRSPSHVTGLNRSASLSCTERVDSESISGSNSQLNNSPAAQYVPDFNVRALADLQYVKVCYAHQHSFSLVFTQVCVFTAVCVCSRCVCVCVCVFTVCVCVWSRCVSVFTVCVCVFTVCVCVCVHGVCVCVFTVCVCVCTLDGLNAEHKLRVWITILGLTSLSQIHTYSTYLENIYMYIFILYI